MQVSNKAVMENPPGKKNSIVEKRRRKKKNYRMYSQKTRTNSTHEISISVFLSL